MPLGGIFPVMTVFLTPTERDRLINAMVNWPASGSSVLTLGKPGLDGQIQFILLDPEPSPTGDVEASRVDKGIIDSLTEKETDDDTPGPTPGQDAETKE